MTAYRCVGWLALAALVGAGFSQSFAAPICPAHEWKPEPLMVIDQPRLKATCAGKYKNLLRKIEVEGDKASYSDFRDYGYYTGTSYAGFDDLPVGYWVYVYPHWYIWQDTDPNAPGVQPMDVDNLKIRKRRQLEIEPIPPLERLID